MPSSSMVKVMTAALYVLASKLNLVAFRDSIQDVVS
jgi:hypothetical protein